MYTIKLGSKTVLETSDFKDALICALDSLGCSIERNDGKILQINHLDELLEKAGCWVKK